MELPEGAAMKPPSDFHIALEAFSSQFGNHLYYHQT
jgi:hypothetical protein